MVFGPQPRCSVPSGLEYSLATGASGGDSIPDESRLDISIASWVARFWKASCSEADISLVALSVSAALER